MDSLNELKLKIDESTEERNWNQFHTPSNLAKSISIEPGELLECFQWSDTDYDLNQVEEELADVFNYCIQLASVLNLDVKEIILKKVEKNAMKYPKDKASGNSAKYDKL
jgi:NTP pyrophosphatase (non-canonical NTP hydrolase)